MEYRDAKLQQWLNRVPAQCLWQQAINGTTIYVTAYNVQGHVVIVQEYGKGGFEIYIPASKSPKISDTFEAVQAFCEVVPDTTPETVEG